MISRLFSTPLVFAIVLLAACAPAPATGTTPQATNTTAAEATPPAPAQSATAAPKAQSTVAQTAVAAGLALFTVVSPDGKTTPFTRAALEALPQTNFVVPGKGEAGPALLEVLKAAGIPEFQQVTVTGDTVLMLTKDQVTADVVLDFTNRGTVKLAAISVLTPQWPKDITKIEVK